jgi:hypothetical protein
MLLTCADVQLVNLFAGFISSDVGSSFDRCVQLFVNALATFAKEVFIQYAIQFHIVSDVY